MAENEIACILNRVTFTDDADKAEYLADLKAFCLDLKTLIGAGLFIEDNTTAGPEYFTYIEKTTNRAKITNPWLRALVAANLAVETGLAATRTYQIVEMLEAAIKEAENDNNA